MILLYKASVKTLVEAPSREERAGVILKTTKRTPQYQYIGYSRMFETEHDLKKGDSIRFKDVEESVLSRTFHADTENATGGFVELWLGAVYYRRPQFGSSADTFSKEESDKAVQRLLAAGFVADGTTGDLTD